MIINIILATSCVLLIMAVCRTTDEVQELKHELLYSQLVIKKHQGDIDKLKSEVEKLKK